MANEEHLAILRQGARVWNQWREENSDLMPNLNGAKLSGATLRWANLRWADLRRATLSRADLRRANLSEARLHQADLSETDLSGGQLHRAYLGQANLSRANLIEADLSVANLIRANLHRANLIEAHLSRANLIEADLSEADLSRAAIGYTSFGNVDLSTVKGLEAIRHQGPSSIGIDTIYRSKGNIPRKFLLDAGMPKDAIDYLLPLAGKAIDFYTCFISYSTQDQDFAARLHADLQAKGVRCWFALDDIAGGKKIHEQINQAIRVYDKLLVILSEHSMSSKWVNTEIYHARQQEEEEKRRKLFPVSLVPYERIRQWKAFDADVGKDMAREVREYFIPDFSQWKDHDTYQKAFDRLLRDLKAEAS